MAYTFNPQQKLPNTTPTSQFTLPALTDPNSGALGVPQKKNVLGGKVSNNIFPGTNPGATPTPALGDNTGNPIVPFSQKDAVTTLKRNGGPGTFTPPTPPVPPTDENTRPGSESGPGILENWFNMRANGTDPAFEYASKRGMDALFDRYSAMGLGNSGAARQGESDLMANLVSQRMGQLDALAGGASGEHRGRVNDMFDQIYKEATGRAGTSGIYDTGAASAWGKALEAMILMALNKAGVDSKANQQGIGNIISGIAAF